MYLHVLLLLQPSLHIDFIARFIKRLEFLGGGRGGDGDAGVKLHAFILDAMGHANFK